jgi:hypothetical protein
VKLYPKMITVDGGRGLGAFYSLGEGGEMVRDQVLADGFMVASKCRL